MSGTQTTMARLLNGSLEGGSATFKLWLASVRVSVIVWLVVFAGLALLALYNLDQYPLTWFDEGSHLHVPKTLVNFGVYADRSSEGFRYYGPTVGIGPTVMLPIAASLKLFGIGLFQARLVMAAYLIAAMLAFFWLARSLGSARFALAAVALLATSRGVSLLEYGRQVLGEVPGFFFIVLAFGFWFRAWERSGWMRLVVVGFLMGLGIITKYQFLIMLAPALLVGWIANLVYFRTAPQRVFLVPGVIAALCFTLWQLYLIFYLGPATSLENFAMLRETASGAAVVFSPDLIKSAASDLVNPKVYAALLIPVLLYSVRYVTPRTRQAQQWALLYLIVIVNLAWFVFASIGWLRYAFLGLGIAGLFVARVFSELTGDFQFDLQRLKDFLANANHRWLDGIRWAAWVVLGAMIVIPLAQTTLQIVAPPFNAPAAMAVYLDDQIPRDAVVETWEPELGFLTDHNYHFPPASLLPKAVTFKWLGAPPPSQSYDAVATPSPEYVIVGKFGRWVELYPMPVLQTRYRLLKSIGEYELYVRVP